MQAYRRSKELGILPHDNQSVNGAGGCGGWSVKILDSSRLRRDAISFLMWMILSSAARASTPDCGGPFVAGRWVSPRLRIVWIGGI